MPPRNKELNALYIISFMDLFAVGLTFPLLSNHLKELGASHFTIGLLASLYSGIQVISGPIIGSWSDISDRKNVLRLTLISCSICYFLLGLTNSISFITIVRFLLGVTKHTQSLCKALISDILPANQRASAFGRSTALATLGFIIGPIIGGHLAEVQNGFMYVCALTSALFVVNTLLTTVITDVKKNEKKISKNYKTELCTSVYDVINMEWRSLWDVFLLRFIFGFAMTMYFSQQSTYLEEQFHLTKKHRGYVISYFSTIGMVTAFVLNYITDYFYKNDPTYLKRLTHFFFIMALSTLLLCSAPSIFTYLLFLVPYGLSTIIVRIVSMELMLKQAQKDHRGSLSGASNSIMSIARFVTPAASGLIADWLGGHAAMMFAVAPPLVGGIIALKMHKEKLKKS